MPQGRWIDSICAYTMLGESEYRLGHYPAAMDNYKAALQLYIEYGNWMQSVQFQRFANAGTKQPRRSVGPQHARLAPGKVSRHDGRFHRHESTAND